MNLFDENSGKPKLFEDQDDKGMSQPIKCIGQIQFNGHSGFTPFGAGVNGLLDQEDVITYLPAQDETTLIWRNKRGDDLLES